MDCDDTNIARVKKGTDTYFKQPKSESVPIFTHAARAFTIPGAIRKSARACLTIAGRAFTMLELQVAMVVMAVGLMGIGQLMVRQSRQVSRVEAWCKDNPAYYVIDQTDPWMRRLGASASLASNATGQPWSPPAPDWTNYDEQLLSYSRSFDSQTMSASVVLKSKFTGRRR